MKQNIINAGMCDINNEKRRSGGGEPAGTTTPDEVTVIPDFIVIFY